MQARLRERRFGRWLPGVIAVVGVCACGSAGTSASGTTGSAAVGMIPASAQLRAAVLAVEARVPSFGVSLIEVAIAPAGVNFYFLGGDGQRLTSGWNARTRSVGAAVDLGVQLGPTLCARLEGVPGCGIRFTFDPDEPSRLIHVIQTRKDAAWKPYLITDTPGIGWELDGTSGGRTVEYTATPNGAQLQS